MRQTTKRFFTILITFAIIGMFLFTSANAFQILLNTNSSSYSSKDIVRFRVSIDLGPSERIRISNLSLEVNNQTDNLIKTCIFDSSGNHLSGCENMIITPINRLNFGYGYIYNEVIKDYGYGYQYGYNDFNGEVTYEIAWNISTENLTEGNYSSRVTLFSGARKYHSNWWVFSINYHDTENPQLSFLSPLENETIKVRNVTIALNVSDNVGLQRVWVNSLAWGAQEINYTEPFNISIPDGTHTVYAYAYDFSGNFNWTNVTFTVDAKDKIAPSLVIISPVDGLNYTTSLIDINIQASDENLDSVWYYVDGHTYPYTGIEQRNFTYGNHLLLAFANDTEGNTNSTGSRFFVDIPYCPDDDHDGYYAITQSCSNGTDCNDHNRNIYPGAQEVCNGIDDNCDLLVDNIPDAERPMCPMQLGVCSGSRATCSGTAGWTCNYGPNYNPFDVCSDNLDNNCNGVVNEGCALCANGETRQCGLTDTGACSLGTQTCYNGNWGSCIGAVYPTAEECNGIDDDCDGITDEGCSGVQCVDGETRQCGDTNIGACSYGEQTCHEGTWGSCIGAVYPTAEECNGIDDDCDGTTDEGCSGGGSNVINYYTPTNGGSGAEVCFTNWQCTEWGKCNLGVQTRICTDLNNCGKTFNKPAEARSCNSDDVELVVVDSAKNQKGQENNDGVKADEQKIAQAKKFSLSKESLLGLLLGAIVIYYIVLLIIYLKKTRY